MARIEAEAGSPQKSKSKFKLIFVLLLVLLLAAGSYAAWRFFIRGEAPQPEPVLPMIIAEPMVFTVNLADAQQRRFLRVTVELGYREKELTEEIGLKTPKIRDLIIEILRANTVADIDTPAGTEKLRAKLIEQINAGLQSGKVEEVYFTEFIIQ